MKQYKVVYVNHDSKEIYDSEYRWEVGYDTRKGQETVLNYYGSKGWKLVSAVSSDSIGSFGEEIYLYLEREV